MDLFLFRRHAHRLWSFTPDGRLRRGQARVGLTGVPQGLQARAAIEDRQIVAPGAHLDAQGVGGGFVHHA